MIGGQGVTLPYPTSPYPPTIPGVSGAIWSNTFTLLRATTWLIPPGLWGVFTGTHTGIQMLDPVSQTWVPFSVSSGFEMVNSDGVNFRIANLSGTPLVQATVTGAGSGYAAASTTVTSNVGGSTWRAVIDGAVASVTVGNDRNGVAGGSNFTVPPVLVVQAPPVGGVQCLAHAVITAGAITSVVVDAAGAGYTQAPGIVVIPDPNDPNAGIITIPALTAVLTAATGAVRAILQTWHGTSQAAVTLAVAGAGTGATATVAINAAAGDDTIFVQNLGGVG